MVWRITRLSRIFANEADPLLEDSTIEYKIDQENNDKWNYLVGESFNRPSEGTAVSRNTEKQTFAC